MVINFIGLPQNDLYVVVDHISFGAFISGNIMYMNKELLGIVPSPTPSECNTKTIDFQDFDSGQSGISIK